MMSRRAGVGPFPARTSGAQDAALSPEAERSAQDPPVMRPARGAKISARLGALAGRMTATASATFARLGLGSIEARVLLALAGGPQSSAKIGNALGVDRAAVSRSVQALVERDLVFKFDGRERAVHLTQDGQDLVKSISRVSAEREKRLLAGLSDREAAALLELLGRLMLNVPDLAELAESGVFESMAGPDAKADHPTGVPRARPRGA